MPSFLQHRHTLELWKELPGREWSERPDTVALTFDDGPDPDATHAVLDRLDEAGVRATFFVVAEQLAAHPALGREVVERGHELGFHGLDHRPHEEINPGDIERGLTEVERLTGVRPRTARPPYGRFTAETWTAVRDLGLEPVYWSAWGEDWEAIAAERIADLVCRDLTPGLVVLLHDSPRYAHRPTATPTADAIPLIARAVADAGLTLGPL